VANSLDIEGDVFERTAFRPMVLEMEKQRRAHNDRMSRMLAADEEAVPVGTCFVGPFHRCDQPKRMALLAGSTAQQR
jgi:hypothetical protein